MGYLPASQQELILCVYSQKRISNVEKFYAYLHILHMQIFCAYTKKSISDMMDFSACILIVHIYLMSRASNFNSVHVRNGYSVCLCVKLKLISFVSTSSVPIFILRFTNWFKY